MIRYDHPSVKKNWSYFISLNYDCWPSSINRKHTSFDLWNRALTTGSGWGIPTDFVSNRVIIDLIWFAGTNISGHHFLCDPSGICDSRKSVIAKNVPYYRLEWATVPAPELARCSQFTLGVHNDPELSLGCKTVIRHAVCVCVPPTFISSFQGVKGPIYSQQGLITRISTDTFLACLVTNEEFRCGTKLVVPLHYGIRQFHDSLHSWDPTAEETSCGKILPVFLSFPGAIIPIF